MQATSSGGASSEGTPERGPSRNSTDLRETLGRSVVVVPDGRLTVAFGATASSRQVTIADSSAMAQQPDPNPDSLELVSQIPSVPVSQDLLMDRPVPARDIAYIPPQELSIENVTLYQCTTDRAYVAAHYYEPATWQDPDAPISDLDRADYERLRTARTLLRSRSLKRPPLQGPASDTAPWRAVQPPASTGVGLGTRPKVR